MVAREGPKHEGNFQERGSVKARQREIERRAFNCSRNHCLINEVRQRRRADAKNVERCPERMSAQNRPPQFPQCGRRHAHAPDDCSIFVVTAMIDGCRDVAERSRDICQIETFRLAVGPSRER